MRIFLQLSLHVETAVCQLYRAVSPFHVVLVIPLNLRKVDKNSLGCLLQLCKYCIWPLIFYFT